jgi:hypothetical protein
MRSSPIRSSSVPSNDPVPEPPPHTVEQRLRRALRVGSADRSDAPEADTWSAAPLPTLDFWGTRPRRARRLRLPAAGRARKLAAVALVGGLAIAWIATSQVGNPARSSRAEAADQPVRVRPARRVADRGRALRALLPVGARCAEPASDAEARCSIAGVEVDYRLLAPDALRAAYLAPLVPGLTGGSMALGAGSGPPKCALGAEEERSWSRPAAPRRAVGRYACRIEQGRAVMWWTVDAPGLLAHAISPGSDLTSLFAWWESHSER